jgi:hypothetical protein
VPTIPVEYASQRKTRERNKLHYRFNHWPIWIFVFFIAPGPLTSDLFAQGFDSRLFLWLGVVVAGTAAAGLCERLPGTEARPLIVRFIEDRPNPRHRRVCYTLAWSELVAFTVLNVAGLAQAVATGQWHLAELYRSWYFPIAGAVWALGLAGLLPRAKRSTRGEGYERRYFYGAVWAVATAQPILWILWKALPPGRAFDVLKLAVFVGTLGTMGVLAWLGRLPRTRPIVADEFAISA